MSSTTRILVLLVAAIGFLFDTYELLMFPVIGTDSIADLLYHKPFLALSGPEKGVISKWIGNLLWIAALCGGVFGLLGGWMIDRFGRKRIMALAILIYSVSPVAAAFSTELWQLVLFRCTTFIGVCVELVAAVTWLAELFPDKRTREKAIAWTLATASLGGILVTEVYSTIVEHVHNHPEGFAFLPIPVAAWRYTLLTGLVPGAMILLLLPFVPESTVWKEKKLAGTLKRPSVGALFSPSLLRTTVVTTILSACGYAAAFGALQLTPSQIVQGVPDLKALDAEAKAATAAKAPNAAELQKEAGAAFKARRGNIQRWQEIGGLSGRILLAILVTLVPSRTLLRMFLAPGIVLLPLTYYEIVKMDYTLFAVAIFFCGLLTVAQFSYLSEFLPKVFPVHLRGTGGSFATNVGGRMIGTMAALLNTRILAPMFTESIPDLPLRIAAAAAIIGGTVYFIAFIASFFLPDPDREQA